MSDLLLDVLRQPYAPHLEDEAEIRDLIMRYAVLTDLGAIEEFLDLCTDDVVRVLGGTLDQTAEGKDDLRAKIAEPVRVAGGDARVYPVGDRLLQSHHLITDEVIRVDGDTAAAVAQFAVVLTAGADRGQHEGTYRFDFRREGGRWRFTRLVVISDSAHNPLLEARGT